ncbi:MAG: VOC family protein, partial [Nitrososphaerales archaeon]
EMTRYDHGVPSWIDLGVKDHGAALDFYTKLFDWTSQDMGEDAGHYSFVSKGERQVAAISPAQEEAGPPRWSTYVNVDDVDDVAKRVETAGGRVIVAPMDVMSAGRMAVFADSTGAVISAWQPRDHIGAQLVNEAGAFVWVELTTSDLGKSKKFYTEVFGWTWGGADEYAEAQVAGRTVAGVMPRRPEMPAEVPDSWLVYIGADDVDAGTQKAKGLGATVLVEPTDIPGTGRFAVLADPQGSTFAIFRGQS